MTVESPIGNLTIYSKEEQLIKLDFTEKNPCQVSHSPLLQETLTQLDAYFHGNLKTFTLPLAPEGTEFQKKVWCSLEKIPYGDTCSYETMANLMGSPSSVRAVASAIGKNPLPILLPCHRVIRKNGTLGGYLGGLSRKEILLNLEQINTVILTK